MVGFFKNIFGKNNKNNDENNNESKEINKIKFIEYIKRENILYNDEYDENKKNVLVMDDKKDIVDGVIDDMFILDDKKLIDINDYNIFTFYGKMAAFNIIEFLDKFENYLKIDYAVLDIIVGGKRFKDGKKVILDGIDVAYELKKRYENVFVVFYTGCMIENEDDLLMNISYVEKFKKYFGDSIYNYLISKSENIDDELEYLHKFFNGEYGF